MPPRKNKFNQNQKLPIIIYSPWPLMEIQLKASQNKSFPQTISGASQQNGVAAFSWTIEVDQICFKNENLTDFPSA